MKKVILIGRSECGKTTLKQALYGQERKYEKTQSISYTDWIIDTPGEYIQTKMLGGALAIYSYESDISHLWYLQQKLLHCLRLILQVWLVERL